MPERFVILGASSFYGRNFAKFVEGKGHETLGLSRPEWDVFTQVPTERGDIVVNFASKNIVAQSWEIPREYMCVNVEGLASIICSLVKKPISRFVHVSTPEVYGSVNHRLDETRRFNPSTPYAASRAAGDMLLTAYRKTMGFPVIITRTANIYGAGQQNYRLVPSAFRCKVAREIFTLEGGGHSVRSFIHVEDACAGLYVAAMKGEIGETYHISTKNVMSIRGILSLIGVEWQDVPDRPGKDFMYAMNSDKLRALGWEEHISLEEGLKDYEDSLALAH